MSSFKGNDSGRRRGPDPALVEEDEMTSKTGRGGAFVDEGSEDPTVARTSLRDEATLARPSPLETPIDLKQTLKQNNRPSGRPPAPPQGYRAGQSNYPPPVTGPVPQVNQGYQAPITGPLPQIPPEYQSSPQMLPPRGSPSGYPRQPSAQPQSLAPRATPSQVPPAQGSGPVMLPHRPPMQSSHPDLVSHPGVSQLSHSGHSHQSHHGQRMPDARTGAVPSAGIPPPMPAGRPMQSAPPQARPDYAMQARLQSVPPVRPAAGAAFNPSDHDKSRVMDGLDDEGPVSNKGPGSFSRIFLGSLEKYRGKSGEVGTAGEEAAAAIAQRHGPEEKRTSGPTLRLRSPLALVEALVLTALFPIVGFLLHRDDPFFLSQRFSWIVFAPLLLGLRHGFAPAMISAVILDALIATCWRTQIVPMQKLPGDTLVGITALAMLTGQFSDVWKRELVRLDGGFEIVRKQLGELMRAHFLLELSHDRLQERTGKGAPSMRDTMLAVHRVAESHPKAKLTDIADPVVEIFQTVTMVEVGALYAVSDGLISREPLAVIGRPAKLDPHDEQIRTALREKRLTYIETGSREGARTNLIGVVPFVDAWNKLHGVLAIESMPLLAFEKRNLEALAIIGSHFADVLATGGKDVQRGQRKEFEIRLRRAIRDLAENDVQSTVFALIIRKGGAVSDSVETLLGGTMRALDFPFVQRDRAGNYCIFILLPVTDEAGARALGGRVERIVRRELNMNITRAGAFHFFHVLRPNDTVESVLRLLETKALQDEGASEHTYIG